VEPEGSSPHSQEPTICSYPKPDQSSPHHPLHISPRSILILSTHLPVSPSESLTGGERMKLFEDRCDPGCLSCRSLEGYGELPVVTSPCAVGGGCSKRERHCECSARPSRLLSEFRSATKPTARVSRPRQLSASGGLSSPSSARNLCRVYFNCFMPDVWLVPQR
jgi:hypothetical protein